MEKRNGTDVLALALSYIASDTARIINEYISKMRTSEVQISEIRLRSYGPLGLTVSGRNISLGVCIGEDAVKETFKRVCTGAVFAHRDDICSGYVTLEGGIRVGVCGSARYESDRIVGVGKISALVFRIPCGKCTFARELYREWIMHPGGMLICSLAGDGKTTAIRSLAGFIGSGERPRRVVVVDERCEFDAEAYPKSHVDILRGYKRSLGVDIAIRTMSAEVIIVDEVGSSIDSAALLGALGAGVDVIATAHAESLASAMKREYIKELVIGGLFGSVCLIRRDKNKHTFSVVPIELGMVKA